MYVNLTKNEKSYWKMRLLKFVSTDLAILISRGKSSQSLGN